VSWPATPRNARGGLSWSGWRSWSHAGSGNCNPPLPATPTGMCARRFSRAGRLLAEQVHARLGAAAWVPGHLLAWFTGPAAGSLVVAQCLAGVPGPAIDDAELAFPGAAGLVVIGGGEFQGLLVTAQGGVEMLQEHRLTLARYPGVSEALLGNRAEATEGRGPVVPAGVRDQVARHKGQICMTATSRPSTEFPHRTAVIA
jgi:hypothetical protein